MFEMGNEKDDLHLLVWGKGSRGREMEHARMLLWRDLDSGF